MPFCSQCGVEVGGADSFCARCGARQPVQPAPGSAFPPPPRPPSAAADPFSSVTPRTASILCYVPGLGWICAIIVLAAEKFRHNRPVRFHAFQGLYLFVAWLLNEWVLRWMFWPLHGFNFHNIIQMGLVGLSVLMMIKASHEETYSLPIIGELASRSLAQD